MHDEPPLQPNPTVVFLGLADKLIVHKKGTPAQRLDILNLSTYVVSHFFPRSLGHHSVVLAVPTRDQKFTLLIESETNPRSAATLSGQVTARRSEEPLDSAISRRIPFNEWQILVLSNPTDMLTTPILIPDIYRVFQLFDGERVRIGTLTLDYAPAPPLTPPEIEALLADPAAAAVIQYNIQCQKCGDSIVPYVSLPKTADPESPVRETANLVWYEHLPDEFVCECGEARIPLHFLRESMHGLLRSNFLPTGILSRSSRYSVDSIFETLSAFVELLDSKPPESEVQKFIEANQLLLAPFHPVQIFFKPPVLNKFQADFGVVDAFGDLVYIEIERPSLRLFKKGGARHHELETPLNQVRDWHVWYAQEPSAFLKCIPHGPRQVTRFRTCVIAGRSVLRQRAHLSKLLLTCKETEFMTYDQLVLAVAQIARQALGS